MHSVTLIRPPNTLRPHPPLPLRTEYYAVDSFGQNSVLQCFMLKLFLDSCYEIRKYLRYYLEVQP